jgi:hypothetical protein
LFLLAYSLFFRSKLSQRPEDAITAAKFFCHLRDQPHEIPTITRHRVTELLVQTLALQVELEAGNVMQNIREIAILSRELLAVEASGIDTTRLIDFIWEIMQSRIHLGVPDQPLDELIECMRAATKRRPDLLQGRAAFAMSLISRYYMTSVDDDYEEAMSILDEMTTSGNSQDKTVARFQVFATGLAAALATMRSHAHWTPEYSEEAIYRARTCVSSSSKTEFHGIWNVEFPAKKRFRYFGSIEESVPETPESDQTTEEMVSLALVIRNDGDTTKINEAIKKGRSIAASSQEAYILDRFGEMLNYAFDRTKKIEIP